MQLRFPESEISRLAEQYLQYWYNKKVQFQRERVLTDRALADTVQQQGYLDRELLREIATWISPRRASLIDENSESDVIEITGEALTTQDESVRWHVLTELKGVGHPTASAVLHFFHEAPYPIIDVRTMWSLSVDNYNYSFNYSFTFWQEYVAFCRDLADRNNVDMRTLHRALWEYSRQNQGSRG